MSGDDDALDRRAAKLSAVLRATDPPVPAIDYPAGRIAAARQRRSVRRWRMAAAIAVLIAGASLVRPVRAWIVDAARTLFVAGTGKAAAPVTPAAEHAAAAAPVPTNAVTFTPRPGVFVLEVATRQASGVLRVERAEGTGASAALVGDPGDAELLVRPDGLRIGNRRMASAEYVVRVPATVTRVVLRIGREPARQLAPPLETDLGPAAGARTTGPE
jgi:hypothetical protein